MRWAISAQCRNRIGHLYVSPPWVGGIALQLDEHLLADLARQVSLTLYVAQLSADLQASRRALVTAHEEATRRLRRDLHDGLGAALATMTLQADTARELVQRDPAAAERLLGALTAQTQTTMHELRRIVHVLRPPMLDDLGLPAALQALVNSAAGGQTAFALHLPATFPPLSAATEVAVYRIVQEGITNIIKHAAWRTS